MRGNQNKKALLFYALWIAYFVFLIIQHKFVFLHFDDFGYASLSYGYTLNSNGMNWTFADLLHFLKWHYLNWGGRVLFFAIGIIAIRIGQWFIQDFQACIIFLITLLIYQLVKKKEKDFLAAWIAIILYGMTSLSVFSDGVFWYTASELYVWPFVFLLLANLLINVGLKKNTQFFLIGLFLFIAGFSQEQVAVLTFVFCSILIIFSVSKRLSYKNIAVYIAGIVGAIIEIFAPGNFVRANSDFYNEFRQLSLFEKIGENLPKLLVNTLGDIFIFILIIISIWLSFIYVDYNIKNKKNKKILLLCNLIVSAFGCYFYLLQGQRMNFIALLCGYSLIVLFLVQVSIYLLKEKKIYLFSLLIGSVCSQGMMLLSPSIDSRTVLPFLIILHLIFADIAMFNYNATSHSKRVYQAGLISVSILSIINLSYVTNGYKKNSEINVLNQNKLFEKSQLIKEGVPVDYILLYRLYDDRFTSQMPYQQSIISPWLKNFYEIPQEVVLLWQDFDMPGNEYEYIKFKDPEIKSIYPEKIDTSTSRDENLGVNIAVTPVAMDRNTVIVINDKEYETVFDRNGYYSTHVKSEILALGKLKVQLLDTVSGKKSEVKYIFVED